MLLDVPFLPDADYVAFLTDCAPDLESVHFSLRNELAPDARPALERQDPRRIARLLARLAGPAKYLLLNAAFHGETHYHDRAWLRALAGPLRRLADEAELRGVLERPERIFSSPFLRPEDLSRVEDCVELIKLCGRNHDGPAFLRRVVRAYRERRWDGNLLDLLDTLGEFAERFRVPNAALPPDFYERLADCGGVCALPGGDCARCAQLFRAQATVRPFPPLTTLGERG